MNNVKYIHNRERWKEEDIEPEEDLMGDQIVEEWEYINMIPVETAKEEQMVKKTRKVPDEKVTQQENNSLTWWEITRPQVRDMIIRQKI